MFNFCEKRVIVMGLGLYKEGSGIEAVKFFLRQGAKVTVTDLRSVKELEPSVRELRRYYSRLRRPSTSSGNKKLYSLSGGRKAGVEGQVTTKPIFILGKHREEDFSSAGIVFQNPSVPADSPYLRVARKAGVPIVNDWSIFLARHTPKLFVGVTGTRGKSTTTALIYEMLKKHYSPIRTNRRIAKSGMSGMNGGRVWLAGNLGVSPLAFIDTYRGEPIVAELSSWLLHHFADVKKSPNIAVVTNIMNDHMDKYRSMKEYIEDKENIFRFQKRGDILVLNYDDLHAHTMAERADHFFRHSEERSDEESRAKKSGILRFTQDDKRIVWFSLKKHVPRWAPLENLQIPGEHNHANALVAAVTAEAAGVPRDTIASVLKTFRGLPGRLELVRTVHGVKYYNDTTATTPEATIAALKALGNPHPNSSPLGRGKGEGKRIVLIAGGADKQLEYREMVKYVTKYCKTVVMLKGTASEKMVKAMDYSLSGGRKAEVEGGLRPNAPEQSSVRGRQALAIKYGVTSMKRAVRTARSLATDGDIVLLSPAAASFGLFKNEFDRGGQFVVQIKKL